MSGLLLSRRAQIPYCISPNFGETVLPVHVRINGREVSAPVSRAIVAAGVLLAAFVVFFVILPLIGLAIAVIAGIAAGTAIAIGASRLLGAKRSGRERLSDGDDARRLIHPPATDNDRNDQR